MDKISGILPSNARVTSVDLKDSSPVRAGTVGFGQAEASSAPRRQHHSPRMEAAALEPGEVAKPMTKDEKQADLVRKMNERFFNTNRTEAVSPSTPGSQQPALNAISGAGAQAAAPKAEEQARMEAIPTKPDEELEGGPL